jgi:cell division septation protein DedD
LSLSTNAPAEPAQPKVSLQLPKLSLKSEVSSQDLALASQKKKVKVTTIALGDSNHVTHVNHLQVSKKVQTTPQSSADMSIVAKKSSKPPKVALQASVDQQLKPSAKPLSKKSIPKHAKGPSNIANPSHSSGWILQLASYSNFANAKRLMSQLQRQGFSPNTRSITRGDGKRFTQVFVGPKATRVAVESLRRSVQLQLKINGLIRRYQS